MTPQLQHAMARYEEARIQYRKAVLASLNGTADGVAIRQAIRALQDANADLKRHRVAPPALPPTPQNEPGALAGWGFVRRLFLMAG